MTKRQLIAISFGAIVAIWLIWLADLAIDIRTMFDDGFWKPMARLPLWQIQIASFALFLFPLVSAGVYVLNKGLRQPILCCLLAFIFSTACIYMHSSYFFFARASAYYANTTGAEQALIYALLSDYTAFKNIFGAIFLIGTLIVSLWLFMVVVLGKTQFPRSFALLSPLTGVVLGRILKAIHPSLFEFFILLSFLLFGWHY